MTIIDGWELLTMAKPPSPLPRCCINGDLTVIEMASSDFREVGRGTTLAASIAIVRLLTGSALLHDLANVARADADAITQYAWPPRGPLSDEERLEMRRLDALSRQLCYRASEAEYEEQEDAREALGLRARP